MIELERHIEILLLKNDCVIVPCLGGFLANHIPATYDETDNLFIPPQRTLGFNPKLNINDSLLIQSYTETYDISYPEAQERILREVNELKQHIFNNGLYELSDIGTLYLNSDGNLEFRPCEAGILTPDLYSLSSFEMKKNNTEIINTETNTDNNKYISEISDKTVTFRTAPLSKGTEEYDKLGHVLSDNADNNDNINSNIIPLIKIRIYKGILAVIVAIITFLAWSSPINNNNNNIVQMGYMDNGIIQNIIRNSYNNISKEDIKLKQNNKINTDTKKIKNKNKKDTSIDIPSKINKNYYCIVLASRVSKKNADIFVDKLKAFGYKARTVIEENNSVKVIFGHYNTKNDAYNALNNLRESEYFYDAWVYNIK